VIIAVGGAGARTFAAGGSAATDKSRATVEASADNGTTLTTQHIYVLADETSDTVSTSEGGFAGAQFAAFGAAVVVDDLADDVQAQATAGSTLSGSFITISAATTGAQVLGIAVGGTGAANFAGGGSVVTNTLGGTTEAILGGDATLEAERVVEVSAVDSGLKLTAAAGSSALSVKVAIGAAVATDIDQRSRLAHVDEASVTAGDLIAAADADNETIQTIAVGGDGAGNLRSAGP
jgi:hypothetical protein